MEKLFITYIFYIVSCLLMSTQSFSRNLQFSHFVEGYLFDFPPELALFVDNTGNIIDPYLANRGNNKLIFRSFSISWVWWKWRLQHKGSMRTTSNIKKWRLCMPQSGFIYKNQKLVYIKGRNHYC